MADKDSVPVSGGSAIIEQDHETTRSGRLRKYQLGFLLTAGLGLLLVAGVAYAGLREVDVPSQLIGTDLGGEPAPGFVLTNQHGDAVALADQRGKVTVLTFLYTNCPDVCPLTAAQLRSVEEQLGTASDHVAMIAVSVDPERDTVNAAYEFSASFGLVDRWSFLIGSREELEPIWDAYFVGVAAESEVVPHDDDTHAGTEPHVERLLHSAPVFLIDAAGDLRVVHTTGNDPSSVTNNLLRDIRNLVDKIPESGRTLSPGSLPG